MSEWHPSAPQVVQLARGESIVEWSGKHGWRVVPLSEIPMERETHEGQADRSAAPESDRLRALSDIGSGSLTPAQIAQRWPHAARKAGIR